MVDGQVMINDNALQEPYIIHKGPATPQSRSMEPHSIPENHLFVLGDNRDRSNDSRYWGYLSESDVIGKVSYIWMSKDGDRIGAVE